MIRRTETVLTVVFCFCLAACVTSQPQTFRTGEVIRCEDGERPSLDCQMAFSQYERTLRFDLGVLESAAFGIGLGAQSLLNLDSITGDLLAHQRQICVDYNNCLISKEEYRQETKYLRQAQLKIREATYMAQSVFGPSLGLQNQMPPGTTKEDEDIGKKDESVEGDESKQRIHSELDQLNNELKQLADQRQEGHDKPLPTPLKPLHLEYSFFTKGKAQEKVRIPPGAMLRSGDLLKFSFVTDGDGYVYIVNYDALGNANILFPHPSVSMDNRVKAARVYETPAEDWYSLDRTQGKETVYLIASPYQIKNLDVLMGHLKEGNRQRQGKMSEVRLKGALSELTSAIEEKSLSGEGSKSPQTVVNKYGMTAVKIEFIHR